MDHSNAMHNDDKIRNRSRNSIEIDQSYFLKLIHNGAILIISRHLMGKIRTKSFEFC